MSTEADKTAEAEEKLDRHTRWWHRLNNSELCQQKQWQPLPTAHRAILRRCSTLNEVMLSEPFLALWQTAPESDTSSPARMEREALIAWVLSFVKEDGKSSLAKAMGQKAGEGSDRPKVSTLRFQQLIKSRDVETFARRLRRVLPLTGSDVSVQSLAREVNNWYWQHRNSAPETNPARRQVLRWAMDYYAEVSRLSNS